MKQQREIFITTQVLMVVSNPSPFSDMLTSSNSFLPYFQNSAMKANTSNHNSPSLMLRTQKVQSLKQLTPKITKRTNNPCEAKIKYQPLLSKKQPTAFTIEQTMIQLQSLYFNCRSRLQVSSTCEWKTKLGKVVVMSLLSQKLQIIT